MSLTAKEQAELLAILHELELTEWERYRRNSQAADKERFEAGGTFDLADSLQHARRLRDKVERGDTLTSEERSEVERWQQHREERDRMYAEHCQIIEQRRVAWTPRR